RLVPLAVGERACPEDRAAVRRDLDLTELGLGDSIRDLDVARDAYSELPGRGLLAALPLLVAQLRVADRPQRQLERALIVARVVARVGRGRVRERLLRDEVRS